MGSILTMVLLSFLRHLLTTIAGLLVAKGLLKPEMVGPFNEVLLGVGTGLLGLAWSLLKNWRQLVRR